MQYQDNEEKLKEIEENSPIHLRNNSSNMKSLESSFFKILDQSNILSQQPQNQA